MFGKKESKDTDTVGMDDEKTKLAATPPLKPFSNKATHVPGKKPVTPLSRGVAQPGRSTDRSRTAELDSKSLLVGRDICLNGEITACERLIVQGQVEIVLSNARLIEVSSTGFFKGSADVAEAEIDGRFEGELTVRDRLVVRSNGRISGKVRYGKIEIESGGQISGDMQSIDS